MNSKEAKVMSAAAVTLFTALACGGEVAVPPVYARGNNYTNTGVSVTTGEVMVDNVGGTNIEIQMLNADPQLAVTIITLDKQAVMVNQSLWQLRIDENGFPKIETH